MLENTIIKQIDVPFKKEKLINPSEIKIYFELLKSKEEYEENNNNKIAEDLFKQLIDNKG